MAGKRRGNKEGSIQLRPNGRWRVQVSLQGKRISYSAKTRGECQLWLKDIQKQIDAGLTFAGANETLLEYLDGWLVSIKSTIRPHTWSQYSCGVHYHIAPVLGNITLKDLQADRIQQFYEYKLKSGSGKRTVEILHSILHRALKQAVKMGIIGRNPTDATNPPRPSEREMKFLDENQVNQLLMAAKGDRDEVLYHLAIVTGMRESELLGLQWGDLDWQNRTLMVQRQAKREDRNEGYFAPLKTRAGRRTLVLGKKTIERLREHYQRQFYEIQSEKNWKHLDLIFPSTIGTPQNQANLYRHFVGLLKRAGLPRIRFHDLRHAAASLMLNHGVPVIVVSRRLGHSKVSVTLDIYGHMFPEMQNEAAEMIDDLITPIEVEIPKSEVKETLGVYG